MNLPPRLDIPIYIKPERPIGFCVDCNREFVDYDKAVEHMYITGHYITQTIYGQRWLCANNKPWFCKI